jgi:hypothetical protein
VAAEFTLYETGGTPIVEIAGRCFDKRVTRRLNGPSSCEFRVSSDDPVINAVHTDGKPVLCVGYRRLVVELDGPGLFFNGYVWSLEDEGDENVCYTKVTCYDPMKFWNYRPARDGEASGDAGDFTDPTFIQRLTTAPQIMEEILVQSANAIDVPSNAEGDLFIDFPNSTFAGGGVDLSGAPTNFPMTIMDVANLLISTGELDIVITPIVSGSDMCEVHCFNGDFGTDLSGSVELGYGTGDFNSRAFKRTETMDTMCNKLWYYLGPREDTQHWRANITGDDPDLPDPPQTDIDALIGASRSEIAVMMDIKIHDQQGNEASARELYRRLWQVESILRVTPQNLLYFTPVRGSTVAPGDFDIGDLISVAVDASKARAAAAGVQRVYAYTIEIDDDAVEALGELVTSPDNEAA